ncbi:MAG: baseplate J/gp47 family protein [Candidatus Sedimenticola sp. (ex Thyasira tokunagai)]
MPFNRPDLQTQKERIAGDIEARLPGADPRVRRSLIGELTKVWAGAAHGLQGHISHIAEQILPTTCDADTLDSIHIPWWLPSGRKASAKATGRVTCSGTDGSVIGTGTSLQSGDGREYTTDTEATIAAGTATVAITAVAPGAAGNDNSGITLNFISTVPGVSSQAIVDAPGLSGGTDIESPESALERLKERVQKRHTGRNGNRYESWAKEVPGVTRAWCFDNWYGIGTVGLFFVRDNDANLIPDAAEVQTVQDYIDPLKGVGMGSFSALAPIPHQVDVTIQLSPNTSTVQVAITAELEDFFLREARPEDGEGRGKLPLSHVREAVSIAAGEYDHNVPLPAADIVPGNGEMPVLGTITFEALP